VRKPEPIEGEENAAPPPKADGEEASGGLTAH
jgi:hypothetical protein